MRNLTKLKVPASLAWLSDIRTVRYRGGMKHAAYLTLSFMATLARLKWLKLRTRVRNPSRKLVAISLIENFGDIVACEPVAGHVKQKYPNAFILWVVRKPYQDLVKFNPNVDRVLTLCCMTEWIWLSKFKLFDRIVDLHFSGWRCARCLIGLNPNDDNSQVGFENYLAHGSLLSSFSQNAGLPKLNEAPTVRIPTIVSRNVDQETLPPNFAVIHCAALDPSKDWPAEKWRALAEKVVNVCDVTIVEVGISPVLKQFNLSGYVDLCGKLSLLETAEVIRRSLLFIGVDSGPAHFANALGVFGVVLLGRYRGFDRYLPYSGNYADRSKAELLYGNGSAASIEVEQVFNAVTSRLKPETSRRQVA